MDGVVPKTAKLAVSNRVKNAIHSQMTIIET